jgi:hypothetical protein
VIGLWHYEPDGLSRRISKLTPRGARLTANRLIRSRTEAPSAAKQAVMLSTSPEISRVSTEYPSEFYGRVKTLSDTDSNDHQLLQVCVATAVA